jgi:hypothetical protein
MRHQVSDGPLWEIGLEAIVLGAPPDVGKSAAMGLDNVVLHRFTGDSLLDQQPQWGYAPWTWWRKTNPRMAELCALAKHRETLAARAEDWQAHDHTEAV